MTSSFRLTYSLDLEIITKSSSPSSASSTISESSNSTAFSICTKRARTPRKRPNQSSAEAAALLSTISPRLFSPTNLRRTDNFPLLLPSFPIPDDASLLLREPISIEKLPVRLEPKVSDSSSVCSLPYLKFQDPCSPNIDAESILNEEVEEGMDSIMGISNLSPSSNYIKDGNLNCLVGFGGLGFGFGNSSNMRRALRKKDEGEWWRTNVVFVKDIVPKLKVAATVKAKKKRKKNKKKLEDITCRSLPEDRILNPRLWLKLDYEDVIKEWSGGSPFSGKAGSVETSADASVRLGSIDLFGDVGGRVVREASMQRYKEKRRARFFSKKIRYKVRKLNADQRPRVKEKLLHEAAVSEAVDAVWGIRQAHCCSGSE